MIFRASCLLLPALLASAQVAPKLHLKNVKSEDTTYKGRTCVRITDPDPNTQDGMRLGVLEGTDFGNGTIELDLTGDTLPNAAPTARGFTGIAFRVAGDGSGYEGFYLRPKNGRADDQEQRNHSTQYISFPDFPWQKLRQETPGRYESYVDLVPGEWTHMKVEVQGVKARLYVNGAPQPVLVVNDLKRGTSHGAVGYWIGPGTEAHFANLKIAAR